MTRYRIFTPEEMAAKTARAEQVVTLADAPGTSLVFDIEGSGNLIKIGENAYNHARRYVYQAEGSNTYLGSRGSDNVYFTGGELVADGGEDIDTLTYSPRHGRPDVPEIHAQLRFDEKGVLRITNEATGKVDVVASNFEILTLLIDQYPLLHCVSLNLESAQKMFGTSPVKVRFNGQELDVDGQRFPEACIARRKLRLHHAE